jgi:hypothetical protein
VVELVKNHVFKFVVTVHLEALGRFNALRWIFFCSMYGILSDGI